LSWPEWVFVEREEIALEIARGTGVQAIARKLGRLPRPISGEIRRDFVTRGGGIDYRAITAQWDADRAVRCPEVGKLAGNPTLRAYVRDGLAGRHAPMPSFPICPSRYELLPVSWTRR